MWCSQTPHPEPCEYFLTHDPKYNTQPINKKSDFFQLSLKLALDRAIQAQANTYRLGLKWGNELEKAAWADCIKLYDYTIKQLKTTLDTYTKRSQVDAQTWLSSALTNLDTCRAGFIDFGVTNDILSTMTNNVSSLISNTLAMNKVPYGTWGKYKQGFPNWVSPGNWKLPQSTSPAAMANIVVAQDGSGNYTTVVAAVAAATKMLGNYNGSWFVIYVKAGTYEENVEINLHNITLVGDGIGKTIITGSRSVRGGYTTFASATVAVVGDRFIGQGITFQNTAGAANGQAVAVRVDSDLSVFYQCSFEGHQDTLYIHSQRQFYRECDIYGTVDFIFGNAAAVLQKCNIYARYPPSKENTITAQSRIDPNQNTGISIHDCQVTAAPYLEPFVGLVKTYLGRPWKKYSRTVFMKTYLGSLINPAGWLPWRGDFALSTLYYGEYMNTGPGSSTAHRVNWTGYHDITDASVASHYTVENFIAGELWLPATNVPFTAGL
ncbi:hypothetical protein Vadar_000795 [Vaccinium darrowii]|uniref:Uncharacterized protein n=1 Tax=Vaccinium darrowii TaxID=229202 RepID=A0ACB7Z8P0_9ERIC|nr:hypothetical protein Vadar_000795 [Vaccinium darrowii]